MRDFVVFLKTLSTSVCAREPLEWAVDLHNVPVEWRL